MPEIQNVRLTNFQQGKITLTPAAAAQLTVRHGPNYHNRIKTDVEQACDTAVTQGVDMRNVNKAGVTHLSGYVMTSFLVGCNGQP